MYTYQPPPHRLGTILFGLVALYYVAVSFAETVKSSAPLVTVVIVWLLRGKFFLAD